MEDEIVIQIVRLPEGVFLATSDRIQGLVVQGRTLPETIRIACEVAGDLLKAQGIDPIPDLRFKTIASV